MGGLTGDIDGYNFYDEWLKDQSKNFYDDEKQAGSTPAGIFTLSPSCYEGKPAYRFNEGNKENKLEQDIAACSMYFDTEKANIIFATNQNGKVQKFVVEPNYKTKANGTKFTANAFITAGVTQQYNLDEDKYIKIR